MDEIDERHFLDVADSVAEGYVVPFLGAGANLCDRPDEVAWEPGRYLPNGSELAHALAEKGRYPVADDGDLLRVSQYIGAVRGEKDLYRYLRTIFDVDYPPNSLHRFLARIPAFLRERGAPQLLAITTNYDDLLERALDAQGEAYDLVWYEAKHGRLAGKFIHRAPGAEPVGIDVANEYDGLSPDQRPVILKLHGAIDRSSPRGDSFVITEDDYIDYLSRGDIGAQIPITIRERMTDSHFLFLGYSMRDWNLRVILSRIWGSQELDVTSWAIQRDPEDEVAKTIEQKLWSSRGDVDLVYATLSTYIAQLSTAVFGGAVEPASA